MVTLRVREAETFYFGEWEEVNRMLECLKVSDKNWEWKARAIIRRFAYMSPEKAERIRESMKWIRFYDGRTRSFGTGLLPIVKEHLEHVGIEYRIRDFRKPEIEFENGDAKFRFVDEIEARPEQLEALRSALREKRGILHLATNFGKTEVACGIISAYKNKTGKFPRTLFLIHRKGLAEQTKKRFEKHLGVPVAMIGGGKKSSKRITVSTTQTAANLIEDGNSKFLDFLEKCDLLFLDEFHTNKSSQATKISRKCMAGMRFGLSGTIDTTDPVKMMRFTGITGPVISHVSNKELVALGRSAKPIIRLVRYEAEPVSGNYFRSYRLGVVNNYERNMVLVRETLRYVSKGKRTLITVGRIRHGIILQDMLKRKSDLRVEFIHGGTPLYVRRKIVKKFEKDKIPILIASPIFDVGVDIPAIQAWCNAAAGRGWELCVQRLGRTLRKKEGDNRVWITDLLDEHNKFLAKHALIRFRFYLDEDIGEVKVVEV